MHIWICKSISRFTVAKANFCLDFLFFIPGYALKFQLILVNVCLKRPGWQIHHLTSPRVPGTFITAKPPVIYINALELCFHDGDTSYTVHGNNLMLVSWIICSLFTAEKKSYLANWFESWPIGLVVWKDRDNDFIMTFI